MKFNKWTLALAAVAMLAIAGCGTTPPAKYSTQIFNAEKLAVDSAANATSGFNLYYHTATNGVSEADLARLESARLQIYAADRDMSKAVAVLEGLRQAYVANSADTNKTALDAGLVAVQSQSSNIVGLVKQFSK